MPSLTAGFFGAAGFLAVALVSALRPARSWRAGLLAVGCGAELMATGAERALLTAGAGVAAAAIACDGFERSTATCLASTAPAVTIAAAARPAAAFVASALAPACSAPPAAAPAAAVPPPAAAAVPPLAAAVVPRWASSVFLSSSSGATGKTAASALLVSRSCLRKAVQRSQVRRCRRTGALVRRSPSATSPSSSRTSSQVSSRASAASASDTRARTSSDLTDGTVVSIASAICS